MNTTTESKQMKPKKNIPPSDMTTSASRSRDDKEKRESTNESKESTIPARAAREAAFLPPVIDIRHPPSLETLLAFAHVRCRFFDDAFTREWHRIMSDEYMWCYPDTGAPIRHWPAYFRRWRANRAFFERLRDPERLPDVRRGKCGASRHADSYLPAQDGKEDFLDGAM